MKLKDAVRDNVAVETSARNNTDQPLSPDLLSKMNAYWRAANYLSVGQGLLPLRQPLAARTAGNCRT